MVPRGSANPKTRYVFPCSSLPKCSDQLRGRFLDVVWVYGLLVVFNLKKKEFVGPVQT